MKQPVKVLIVEDSEDDAKLELRALRQGGFDPTHRRVQTAKDVTQALADESWDAVISDFAMPGFTGLDALRILRSTGLDIPFILVSGTIGEELAVNAMKLGASDYLMKGSLERLAPALARELRDAKVRADNRVTQKALAESDLRFRQMATNIRDVFLLIDADSNRILYASPAYEEIWGRSCESLYEHPESWIESIHPDDRASTYENYRKGMATGTFQHEYRIVRPDDTIRWMEARGFPVRDSAGKTVRIAGIVADVTERKQAAQELRESERRLSDMLGNVELVSIMIDREARISYCNDYFLRLTGWQREQVLGQSFFEMFIPPDLTEKLLGVRSALLANRPETWLHENEILTRAGERRLIRWNNSVLRSASGDVVGTASIGEDITEQKRALIKIEGLNRVYAMLSGINALIMRVRDRNELLKEACSIAVEKGGFQMAWAGVFDRTNGSITSADSAGMSDESFELVRQHLSQAHSEIPGNSLVATAIRDKKATFSNDVQNASGLAFSEELAKLGSGSIAILPLQVADEVVGVFKIFAKQAGFFDEEELKLLAQLADDIAYAIDHIEKQVRLDYLAYFDVLTGLANRRLFLERLAPYKRSAVSGGYKVAIYLMDLERFKNTNDSLGRPAGDILLRQVAEWLTLHVGDANLLARVGADQFAIVLPETRGAEDVARLLEKTIKEFQEHPFFVNDVVLRVAVKVGVALFPDDGASAEILFRNAEIALKKAKASGDRYLFYTRKMTDAVSGMLTLENQLRQALDNGEFVLHYQPKINLATGLLTGAEALIRWNDPRTGLAPPGRFIPMLEETGLIHEVGRWALHTALEDYLRWRAAGLEPVRIAVNVSPQQLRHRDFVAEIAQAIGVVAHAAKGLELEITESVVMEDIERSIATLKAIRALGVTVAIDDFGTGFSSLSYLARLPVDALKIDRSFVIDMTVTPVGLALVSTIINLAHGLKLKVVAEGVETEEQSRLLRLVTCDEMQGFLFSRPVPAEIFETRFLASASREVKGIELATAR